jgi:hypothetical protein
LLYYYFFVKTFSSRKTAIGLTFFLALNPYMTGAGIFVYTDMLTMFFLVLLLLAIRNRSLLLSLVAATGGLLCRQYYVFIVAAAVCYCGWCFLLQKQKRELLMASALMLAAVPLFALFILWKGFCPVNTFRTLYSAESLTFHLNSITLYFIQLFVYMLPVIFFISKSLYLDQRRLIISLIVCWVYWLFPVAVSAPGIAAGKYTVGYFHRLIRIWPGVTLEQWAFFICFALAIPIAYAIISDTVKRLKSRNDDFTLFMDFSIILFFIVMPFSYLHWEKYFLPLLPIAAVQLVATSARINKPVFKQSESFHSPFS